MKMYIMVYKTSNLLILNIICENQTHTYADKYWYQIQGM